MKFQRYSDITRIPSRGPDMLTHHGTSLFLGLRGRTTTPRHLVAVGGELITIPRLQVKVVSVVTQRHLQVLRAVIIQRHLVLGVSVATLQLQLSKVPLQAIMQHQIFRHIDVFVRRRRPFPDITLRYQILRRNPHQRPLVTDTITTHQWASVDSKKGCVSQTKKTLWNWNRIGSTRMRTANQNITSSS